MAVFLSGKHDIDTDEILPSRDQEAARPGPPVLMLPSVLKRGVRDIVDTTIVA